MKLVNNNLEVFTYSKNGFSIKDLESDVNIGDAKWNFIFDSILKSTNSFYFLGEHLNYGKKMKIQIDYLSEKYITMHPKYRNVFFKIKPANLIVNRSRLANLWLCFESPAIIFLNGDLEEGELIRLYNLMATYEEIAGSISELYLIHKNFEINVLWLLKSSDMPDIKSLLGS